ncbi:hypothetical protein TL16_g11282 [Triparma laevis f. inornata]|uniref:Uncharacterized protein n=1 Tax=Triparma laevis f. inornata TaxID=1714386 RepID=A0A9W7ET32_9STRA|nr:hypothetical protein TL16_g11282 [Triparma laevis f. inornata]
MKKTTNVLWTFNKETKSAFTIALTLKIIKDSDSEIVIQANSISIPQTINTIHLNVKDAQFILKPHTFGRTILTLSAEKTHFLSTFLSPETPLTQQESKMLERSISLNSKMVDAKRLPSSATDTVETYLKWKEEGSNIALAKCVATIDTSVRKFFSEIWLLSTYEKHKNHIRDNGKVPRKIWNEVDGSRGILYVTGIKFPSGFTDRIFHSWITWMRRVNSDGTECFIIGFEDADKYKGSRQDLDANFKSKNNHFIQGFSSGVHILEELSPKICRWTRTQFVDLRVPFPRPIMEVLASVQFDWSYVLQEKFLRNEKEVDYETLEYHAKTLLEHRTTPLTAEQRKIFNSCVSLEKSDTNNWVEIKSPVDGVDMWMSTPDMQAEDIKISIRTGKAVGVVDCPAIQVAAWLKDFNSCQNLRESSESGSDVGRKLVESKANEISLAMVKKFPFPMRNREFKLRDVFKVESNGDCLVAMKTVDDINANYATNVGTTVPCKMTCLWRISNLPVRENNFQQCQVTLLQHLNAGGRIPVWLINIKLPEALSSVGKAINRFRQDDKFDEAEIKAMTDKMKNGDAEVYTQEENAIIDRGMKSFDAFTALVNTNKYEVLHADDLFVSVKTAHVDNESVVSGQIASTMDDEMEKCAAWEYLKLTREQLKRHTARRGIKKYEKNINNHCKLYMNSRDLGVVGFRPREFRNKMVWKRINENKLVLIGEDTKELDAEIPILGVLGSSRTVHCFERVESEEGFPQTKVTMQTRVDIAGAVPSFIMNRLAKRFANNLSLMRKRFDKTLLIEALKRSRTADALSKLEHTSQESEAVLVKFKALFESREGARKLRSNEAYQAAISWYKDGWGINSLDISCKLEEAAAFTWDFSSRSNTEYSGDVTRTTEKLTPTSQIVIRRELADQKNKNVIREYKNKMVLHWIDDNTIVILSEPASPSAPCSIKSAIRLRRVDKRPSHTRAEFALELMLEASPVSLQKGKFLRASVCNLLNAFSKSSIYFHRQLPIEQFEPDDGKSLAHDLLWTSHDYHVKNYRKQERLDDVSTSSKALIEMQNKYPWFKAMMEKVIEGKLHMNRPVKTKLACVNDLEALQIGKNLIPALRSKKKAETGLDQWTIQNRAVKELLEEHSWLQMFFLVVSKGVVKAAAWGLMWRVTVGAILSVTDLATDIMILINFSMNDRQEYFEAALASIIASFALYLLMVYLQYNQTSWKRILKEVVIVLIGMKAPWDAYKVAKGDEKELGTNLEPLMEMTFNKACELVGEAIPGCLIQMSAIIDNPNDPSKMVLFSIVISAFTTGFTSAQISYDFDTDPAKRLQSPDYYGYVPDNPRKRTIIFFALVMIPSFQLLMKSLCIVLLSRVNSSYAYVYVLADIVLFLSIKFLRKDLMYWMRMEGWIKWPVSILIRVGIKLITDFTGIVQFRHPNEVGGMYWTLQLVVNLGGLFIALYLCEDAGAVSKERQEKLWALSLFLMAGFMLTFGIFLASINKDFIHTFFSLESGSQMTQRKFFEATGDKAKQHAVFGTNYVVWRPIRKEVKIWVESKWIGWTDMDGERPDWLTEEAYARIENDMGKIAREEGGGLGGKDLKKIAPLGVRGEQELSTEDLREREIELSKGNGIARSFSSLKNIG